MATKKTYQKRLIQWICNNYELQEMIAPPKDWEQKESFYYKPDPNLLFYYGPVFCWDIPKQLIPKKFRKEFLREVKNRKK